MNAFMRTIAALTNDFFQLDQIRFGDAEWDRMNPRSRPLLQACAFALTTWMVVSSLPPASADEETVRYRIDVTTAYDPAVTAAITERYPDNARFHTEPATGSALDRSHRADGYSRLDVTLWHPSGFDAVISPDRLSNRADYAFEAPVLPAGSTVGQSGSRAEIALDEDGSTYFVAVTATGEERWLTPRVFGAGNTAGDYCNETTGFWGTYEPFVLADEDDQLERSIVARYGLRCAVAEPHWLPGPHLVLTATSVFLLMALGRRRSRIGP